MGAVVRAMRASDVDAVFALWADGREVEEPTDQALAVLERCPGISQVAEMAGRPVGALLAGHDGRRGRMIRAYVRPDVRRLGIGSAMAAAAERAMIEAGIAKALLVLDAHQASAVPFWRANGWGERMDLVYREKRLMSDGGGQAARWADGADDPTAAAGNVSSVARRVGEGGGQARGEAMDAGTARQSGAPCAGRAPERSRGTAGGFDRADDAMPVGPGEVGARDGRDTGPNAAASECGPERGMAADGRGTVTVRVMGASDYDQVAALWLGTKGMGMRSRDDARAGIEGFLRYNPGTCFVAELDGRAVGAVLCGHDGRTAFVYHTAVEAALRGWGIGRALMAMAEVALTREGVWDGSLVVFRHNAQGNAFWARNGWVERPVRYFDKSFDPNNM